MSVVRHRLPPERQSVTVKFEIGGQKGHLIAGLDENGKLAELFVHDVGRVGSSLQGVIDSWAITISMGLQYGVPLEVFVRRYLHVRFPPEGKTIDPDNIIASSLVDHIMRLLAARFLDTETCDELGVVPKAVSGTCEAPTTLELVCPCCHELMDHRGHSWECQRCGKSLPA